MSKLIKIGERIINIDMIAFAERSERNGVEVVTLQFEQGRKFRLPVGQPLYAGTKEDPEIIPLNMDFRGSDARYIWAKLCELSETWALPGEIEPEAGKTSWPKR
jgi:hypothetical protein